MRTLSGKRPLLIELYSDASIRDAIAGAGGQAANGSLAANLRTGCATLDVLINTVGSRDPVTQGFGTTVLAPAASGSFGAGLVEGRLLSGDPDDRRRFGVRGYASASTARWRFDAESTPVDVAVTGLGAGVFYGVSGTIVPAGSRRTDAGTQQTNAVTEDEDEPKLIAVILDLGIAHRSIGGDFARSGTEPEKVREQFGISGLRRTGLEAGLLVTYGGLKAGATYYHFGGNSPGISRGQVVAGFAVQTTLAKGRLGS